MNNTAPQSASWIERLSSEELSEAIESTGSMCARLYAQKEDTTVVDINLELMLAEFDRRAGV